MWNIFTLRHFIIALIWNAFIFMVTHHQFLDLMFLKMLQRFTESIIIENSFLFTCKSFSHSFILTHSLSVTEATTISTSFSFTEIISEVGSTLTHVSTNIIYYDFVHYSSYFTFYSNFFHYFISKWGTTKWPALRRCIDWNHCWLYCICLLISGIIAFLFGINRKETSNTVVKGEFSLHPCVKIANKNTIFKVNSANFHFQKVI